MWQKTRAATMPMAGLRPCLDCRTMRVMLLGGCNLLLFFDKS